MYPAPAPRRILYTVELIVEFLNRRLEIKEAAEVEKKTAAEEKAKKKVEASETREQKKKEREKKRRHRRRTRRRRRRGEREREREREREDEGEAGAFAQEACWRRGRRRSGRICAGSLLEAIKATGGEDRRDSSGRSCRQLCFRFGVTQVPSQTPELSYLSLLVR